MNTFMEGAATILCIVFGLVLLTVAFRGDTPRLIGYACKGASGPLYAQQEDHFPPCGRIEEN